MGEGAMIYRTPMTEQFRSPTGRKLKLKKSPTKKEPLPSDIKPHLVQLRSLKNLKVIKSSGQLGPMMASTPQAKKLQQPALPRPHSRHTSGFKSSSSPDNNFVELKKVKIPNSKKKGVFAPLHKAK
mmetsp:Transcript_31985/g.48960  ORF Transcript_31985/g.48960 Transcript_31985/m.48960 type:complete len:126 (-) Transcript_31985:343-720(-)